MKKICTVCSLAAMLGIFACSTGGEVMVDSKERSGASKSSSSELVGKLIPRSMSDKAKYYLISSEADGSYIRTLHNQVWPPSSMLTQEFGITSGYSITQIDCKSQRFKTLGYGDNDPSNITMYDNPRWSDVVSGSSKYDLIVFVCNRANQ